MSNKSLIVTIIVIILVAAGVVFAYNTRNAKAPVEVTDQPQNTSGDTTYIPPDNSSTTPETSTSTKPTTMDQTTCKRDFDSNKLKTAQVNIANRTVEIDVKDFGKIQVQFYEKDAPKAVENFLRLVNSGYYDCLTVHRVAKGFVIQAGDPNGNGTGGQSAFGAPFQDELNPETASYKAGYVKGVLAMANSGPNTNGSQFFIMLADVSLNHAYTIFGKVSVGQSVVDKIGQVEINPQMGPTDGSPVTPVVMQSVKIIK